MGRGKRGPKFAPVSAVRPPVPPVAVMNHMPTPIEPVDHHVPAPDIAALAYIANLARDEEQFEAAWQAYRQDRLKAQWGEPSLRRLGRQIRKGSFRAGWNARKAATR